MNTQSSERVIHPSRRKRMLQKRRCSLLIMMLVVSCSTMVCYERPPSAHAFAVNFFTRNAVRRNTYAMSDIDSGGTRQLGLSPTSSSSSSIVPSCLESTTSLAASMTSDGTRIEGIMDDDEFNRLAKIDKTVRAIREQVPKLLSTPLNVSSAADVYTRATFRLNVLVDQAAAQERQQLPITSDDEKPEDDGIVIVNSREELIALSEILVLATAAARQAGAMLTAGAANTQTEIQCQLILDESLKVIRIPWRARVPLLGSPDNINNRFEGLSDFRLKVNGDEEDEDFGKVQDFTIRTLTWNGRSLNGPAIGRAVNAIQSTVTNLQQSPIIQSLARVGDPDRVFSFLSEIRDGFLEQAATALSASSIISGVNKTLDKNEQFTVQVYQVRSINESSGWIEQSPDNINLMANDNAKHSKSSTKTPCPGTISWTEYASSRECLIRFCDEIIPQLTELSIVESSLFSKDATLITTDGSTVIAGQKRLANFYQSMALTRTGTGGSFKATQYKVLDWRNRTVAVHYEATVSSLPLWTIEGHDIYTLDKVTGGMQGPVIRQIRQSKMTAVNPAGNSDISIDGQWMMKNLVAAIDDDGTVRASRDFWTELLMQQPGLYPLLKAPKAKTRRETRNRLSEAVAAKSYYIMTDLYDQGTALFDVDSSRTLPPGAEYMANNVELRGYLGESIIRGSILYTRSIGFVLFGIRDALRQKRIVVEKVVPPRVELIMPSGDIRFSLTFCFRIPTPGVGVILPESSIGPPIKLELVSDYKIDADTGLIVEHLLVETRVNDQLAPGDQVVRWIQQFLKMDGKTGTGTSDGRNGDALKAVSDALLWIRSLNGSDQ